MQVPIRGFFYVRSREVPYCPHCGREMCVVGSRKRKVARASGSRIVLVIRRLRCDSCRRIHHELPDFIVPYKHYSAEVIENILKEAKKTADFYSPCENSTVRRTIQWFSLLLSYLEAAVQSLIEMNRHNSILVNELSSLLPLKPKSLPAGWLPRLVRALVNSGRWLQTRLAVTVR